MSEKRANRLAKETSTYLRSAAHQPVEWYPWGDGAFRKAKELDRPILLDIGATWCHWCHVIDRESYEDPDLAAVINERFVAVKVDRDERPDIDARYQQAVGALTGQGGWPLTAFLTPEGKVFYGGTYYPPKDAFGRPSFRRVLLAISDHYRQNKADAHREAEALYQALVESRAALVEEGAVNDAMLKEAVDALKGQFDPVNGGISGQQKFPHPGTIGWGAASTGTRRTRSGSCPTSRRCSTTTRASCGTTSMRGRRSWIPCIARRRRGSCGGRTRSSPTASGEDTMRVRMPTWASMTTATISPGPPRNCGLPSRTRRAVPSRYDTMSASEAR